MMQNADAPLIRIEAVRRSFGQFHAVDNLSLEIRRGEFFALLGPSGCGKTTLLRMLAGFETPDSGRILLDGVDITTVPPYRRPVNMMFQSYALFPHLDVTGNIAFGLKREGLPRTEIAERVAEMVRLARLDGLEARKPHELSGGQRQRVALARALAKRPRVLLLDEPLAALDKKLREETQFELKDVQRRLGLTFVIVTHDQDEAMSLADRIGVMQRGRLAQVGTPAEIYETPKTRYVADFVGDINLFDGEIRAERDGILCLETAAVPAGLRVVADRHARRTGTVTVAVRPEKLAFLDVETMVDNVILGEIADIAYRGDISLYRVRTTGGALVRLAQPNASRSGGEPPRVGQPVRLGFAADAGVLLEDQP